MTVLSGVLNLPNHPKPIKTNWHQLLQPVRREEIILINAKNLKLKLENVRILIPGTNSGENGFHLYMLLTAACTYNSKHKNVGNNS